MKYRAICKGCMSVFKEDHTPIMKGIPTVCNKCGKGIKVEAVMFEEEKDNVFELIIQSKNTGAIKVDSFIVRAEDIYTSEKKARAALAKGIAETAAKIISNDITLNQLLIK